MIRYRIGLKFEYNDSWIGGTYYFINLIKVFEMLADDEKPVFVIFSNRRDYEALLEQTNYTYLEFVDFHTQELSIAQKIINTIAKRTLGRKIYIKSFSGKLDKLFLLRWNEYFHKVNKDKCIFWIPDFQHKYFPGFFNEKKLEIIESNFNWIMKNGKSLLFSSNDALNDWLKYYSDNTSENHVVRFAVSHPEYESISIDYLTAKYGINGLYFMSPNQFWKHKNHVVVIKAIQELRKRNINLTVLFSGKEHDDRNPEYFNDLKEFVMSSGLEEQIKFLGFLDRREQLKLMKESIAIIQPSKFEGWSTVIEDAMLMGKGVIATDLSVNLEQLGEKGIYFESDNYEQLANILHNYSKAPLNVNFDYDKKVLEYKEALIHALL